MIERNIDYIQATANFIEQDFATDEYVFERGIGYYPRAYRDASGIRFCFGQTKGLPCFVICAGKSLEYLHSAGILDSEIINWLLKSNAKISRLDLAVTEFIEEDLFTMDTVQAWFARDQIDSPLVKGGMKKLSAIEHDWKESIETLYIGNMEDRAKKGIFRAYDKGLEMGIGNEIVSRIELELKRKKAHSCALRIAESNDIAGNFRSTFNVKSLDFERIMDSDVVPPVRGKAKMKTQASEENDSRWAWLLNQVAPSLREAIAADIKEGKGEYRLMQFCAAAGIVERANEFAVSLANYRTQEIEQELAQLRRKFSSTNLD